MKLILFIISLITSTIGLIVIYIIKKPKSHTKLKNYILRKAKKHLKIRKTTTKYHGYSIQTYKELTNNKKISINSSNWMSKLRDDILINKINLPGTHNSGTFRMSALGQCQVLSISEQLKIGIRYFDLRFKDKNTLYIHHGILKDTSYTISHIFEEIKEFLELNKTEGIISKIQVSKEEYLSSYLNKYKDILFLSKDIPTLNQIRGKMWILLKLKEIKHSRITKDYRSLDKNKIQKKYNICEVDDVYNPQYKEKSNLVINFFNKHRDFYNQTNTQDLVMNQISCNPLASGFKAFISFKSPKSTAKKLNNLVRKYLKNDFCGIVIMDYPSPSVIEEIYDSNFLISKLNNNHSNARTSSSTYATCVTVTDNNKQDND